MIRETLAHDTHDCQRRTFPIGYAQGGAVVVPEIKFSQVPVQVLFLAVLIHTAHPAFEDREISLDGVRVHVTTCPFLSRVAHCLVGCEVFVRTLVEIGLVCVQARLAGDV